ncbi:MAG: hypothetical protein F6J93_06270 [Oscillatoria sp. SIO1A7]|nr:hypothetical protein [Oscillatoria sp. SIO1A7]
MFASKSDRLSRELRSLFLWKAFFWASQLFEGPFSASRYLFQDSVKNSDFPRVAGLGKKGGVGLDCHSGFGVILWRKTITKTNPSCSAEDRTSAPCKRGQYRDGAATGTASGYLVAQFWRQWQEYRDPLMFLAIGTYAHVATCRCAVRHLQVALEPTD